MANEHQEEQKFWHQSWFMWLCLIIFWPVGLLIFYMNRDRHPKNFKVIKVICGIFLLLIVVSWIGPPKDSSKNAQTQISQNVEDQKNKEERLAAEKERTEREEAERKAKMKEEYERKQQEKINAQRAKFEKERYVGWNKADEFPADDNMSKAFELVHDYRNIIETTPAETVPFSQIAATPWEYYGKILFLTGYITQLEQAPPENPVAKELGGKYSYGTVMINDDAVWFHVLNSRSDIEKNGPIFKGFFLGKGKSKNAFGGDVQGFKFVGILEKDAN